MATSSIHIGTSSAGALIHNERIFSPDYLITNDKSVNDKKHYDNVHISELENLAKIDYQTHSINNRKLPKTATLIKEAVINLEAHHNLNDLEKVKDTLENEYGYKITDISIHRDEGYIFTENKNYIMGRNQYKNLDETPHIAELDKDNKFYEWTLKNNNWIKGDEIKDYKINHNYHAHIVMLNYDFSKHRTIRNNLKDLSKMQTLVAKNLGMERGKCSSYIEAKNIGVEVQESRKRLNIKEYKVQKRKEKELEKEVQELKKEIYNFKEMQKSITSLELTSDEKKELHRLNSKVKNQEATIEELNKKINELTVTNTYRLDKLVLKQKEINDLKELTTSNEEVNILKNENKSLQEQNKTLESKVIVLEDKINSSANMSDYEAIKKEREQLKKDIFHPTLKKSDDTPATNLEVANHYIKQNKSLKEQNKVLENKVITLEDKIVSSSPQNDLLIKEIKDLKEKVTVLENENKSLKQKIKDIVSLANEKIKSLFQFKIWNNYKHKQTKFDREYINENKEDFWEELVYDNPRVDTLYKDNIENELIKIDDFIPGEKKEIPNYSKMNLADILNSNKADLKEAQDNLKELLEKDKQETAAVNIRKLF